MRHLKLRLYAAIIILVIHAVLLTGVSYAWLTLSTNPEVTNIVASVGANQNLEIALDDGYATVLDVDAASAVGGTQGSTAGNPYTWGNLVDLTYAFSEDVPELRQVKFELDEENNRVNFKYAMYGVDGRVQGLGDLQATVIPNHLNAGREGGVKFYAPNADKTDDGYAYSVTYWMRTNVKGDISLSEAVKRANDGTNATEGVNGVVGGGSYISIPLAGNGTADVLDSFVSNMRVVFVDESANPNSILFEASISAGYSDGVVRKYNLVTQAENVGENPVYVSEYEGAPIAMEKNVAKKLTMYVYLDGEDLSNSDALLQDTHGVKINVQFDNSAIDDSTPSGGAMTGDFE